MNEPIGLVGREKAGSSAATSVWQMTVAASFGICQRWNSL